VLQCVAADLLGDYDASSHSVLQVVAVCCKMLQCDAVCCSVLQRVAAEFLGDFDETSISLLQCCAACCSAFQWSCCVITIDRGSNLVLQYVAVRRSVLHCVAAYCSVVAA